MSIRVAETFMEVVLWGAILIMLVSCIVIYVNKDARK